MSSYVLPLEPSTASGAPVAAGGWAFEGSDASSVVVRISCGRADGGTAEGISSAVLASSHGTVQGISSPLCRRSGFVTQVAFLGGQTCAKTSGAVWPVSVPSLVAVHPLSVTRAPFAARVRAARAAWSCSTRTGPRRPALRRASVCLTGGAPAHYRSEGSRLGPLSSSWRRNVVFTRRGRVCDLHA